MQGSIRNDWCEALGIECPEVESVVGHRKASAYSLLLVTLLERGEPMTLDQVARRLEEAGQGDFEDVRLALGRCRPARPPVYRHGDLYHLDPHSDELDLWAFRLDLKGPKMPPLRVVRADPGPLPDPDVPLSRNEVREAFGHFRFHGPWTAQRVALCVLDAHGGTLDPQRLVDWLDELGAYHHWLQPASCEGWRSGAILVTDAGEWRADPEHRDLVSARKALRERLRKKRADAERRPDPVTIAVRRKRFEAEQARQRVELANLSRVLIHAYPHRRPQAVALVDIGEWSLQTYGADQLDEVRARLEGYGLIAGWQVRPQLEGLGFDPGIKRLGELAPPQKTARLSEQGRARKLTQDLLIRSCCNIDRPLVPAERLTKWASKGDVGRLAPLLASDARSLSLYYEYGRLQGHLRVLWRGWQTIFRTPWTAPGEESLFDRVHRAQGTGQRLELVIGQVRDWSDPWGESVVHRVSMAGYSRCLVLEDWNDWVLDAFDVQLARLVP